MKEQLDSLRKEARQHLQSGQWHSALTTFKQMAAVSGYVPSREDLQLQSLIHFNRNNFKAALGLLQQALQMWPDNVELLANAGVAARRLSLQHASQETDELAVKYFLQAIELDPKYIGAHDGLAAVYGRQKEAQLAAHHGALSLTLKHEEAVASFNGEALALQGAPPAFAFNESSAHVISFSLWGSNPRYTDGALRNLEAAAVLYEGWQVRYYCEEKTVSPRLRAELLARGADVVLMPPREHPHEGLFWRFLPANDPGTKRFLVRDVDSVLNVKERLAVEAWLHSDKHFHVMRDSYSHTDLMLAGMWGGVGGVLPDMRALAQSYTRQVNSTANCDQLMLRREIWPLIHNQCLVHDSQHDLPAVHHFPAAPEVPAGRHIGQDLYLASSRLINFNPGRLTAGTGQNYRERERYLFTISTGRSGTNYLAELLQGNWRDAEVHHERIPDFDINTPGPSTNMVFNYGGNHPEVRSFWQKKVANMRWGSQPAYAEASHFLAKAGLIENLDLLGGARVDIVILKRDFRSIVESFIKRHDFYNRGFTWLFSLDPAYSRNIVSSEPFAGHGYIGSAFWYVLEVWSRAEYYRRRLENAEGVYLHEVNLEQIRTLEGAQSFFAELGIPATEMKIPGRVNAGVQRELDKLEIERLDLLMKNQPVDPVAEVDRYLEAGRTLG